MSIRSHLKELRDSADLSLKDVQRATGIADSTISRIENGCATSLPNPNKLRLLAECYHCDIISLFLECGYLHENDLLLYKQCFEGVDKLTSEEKELVQSVINAITRKRGESNEIPAR